MTTPSYQIRPLYKQRASTAVMQDIITTVLKEELEGKTYDKAQGEAAATKKIADEIRSRLKALDLPRYKYMVQVVLGEQRGQGVRVGGRTMWDADTDCQANATYVSDSFFGCATAYAIYLY